MQFIKLKTMGWKHTAAVWRRLWSVLHDVIGTCSEIALRMTYDVHPSKMHVQTVINQTKGAE